MLDLKFPEDYAAAELAGKDVEFKADAKIVEEMVLPEIDEAFIKDFGIEDGDEEKLRKDVRDNMQREMEQRLKVKNKEAVIEKLLEVNDAEVPQVMIDEESHKLMEQMKQNMQVPEGKSGVDLDPSMFLEQAKRRLSLGLIFAKVIESNELKADEEKVRAQVESVASSYEHPQEVIDWYYGDKQRLAEVESLVMEESVVDWALSQAEVSDKTVPFTELMGQ